MVDRDLVTRKIALVVDDLRAVTPIAQKRLDDYLASATDELVTERYLERMIGRMIDVNYHLVTESGEAPPRDYHESFVALSRVGALPGEFARRLALCAGLRNRIVHAYDDLDPSRVYDSLRDALADVPAYLTAIRDFLDSHRP